MNLGISLDERLAFKEIIKFTFFLISQIFGINFLIYYKQVFCIYLKHLWSV